MGFPWYNGPDPYCSVHFGEFLGYLGKLQERSQWLAEHPDTDLLKLPKLDPNNTTGLSEITPDLVGTRFEFATCQEMFLSLVGMARERIVDACLEWGADYIFWSDDDMLFGTDILLRLYKHQVPAVAALAFTSRVPVMPVVYKFNKVYSEEQKREITDIQPVLDYKQGELQQVDAFGSGVMLTHTDTFKQIGKPWFTSYGVGEDIHYCYRMKEAGIPVYVDAGARTIHKAAAPSWHSEQTYLASRA